MQEKRRDGDNYYVLDIIEHTIAGGYHQRDTLYYIRPC